MTTTRATAGGFSAVIFDFHSTLVDGGEAHAWVAAAWQHLGREGDPVSGLGAEGEAALAAYVDRIWEHARPLDPHNGRDLSPADHRRVYDETIVSAPAIDPELADALYAVMPLRWDAYDDTLPTLDALRERGIRIGVLSNIGFDLGPVLERTGIGSRLDALVMSYEIGVPKPALAIFARTLELLGVPAEETLMVGDSWRDDAAAAELGIRTLILPRTPPPLHGLELVLRLVTPHFATPPPPAG